MSHPPLSPDKQVPSHSPLALVLALVAVLGAACSPEPDPGRRIAAVTWDTAWQTSAAFMDSVIASPSILTFNQGTLFVLDASAPRIVALDAKTGGYLWRLGRAGAGPMEFAGVSALFPDRSGGVGVVDIRNRRATRLDSGGKVSGTISTASMGQQPNQLCWFGANRFLVADVFDPRLGAFDTLGERAGTLDPLWLDLADADWESVQVTLRNNGSGTTCLVALSTGRGFALLAPDREPVVTRYIEDFEVYRVGARKDETKMSNWATYDAEFVADTVIIHFAGETNDKFRLLDRYSAVTGSYIDTYRLPFKTGEFAAGAGMIFVVDTSGTRIVALRPRR